MKKIRLFIVLILLASAFGSIACSENESEVPDTSVDPDPDPDPGLGAFKLIFMDDFNADGDLSNWEKTSRADYNSAICLYQANNPIISTFEEKSCLLLTATKEGSEYHSGHVKSLLTFRPEINEEYRLTSSINLFAMDVNNERKGFRETYGAWPAFWTVNETDWPTNGEMDILEAYTYGNDSPKFASNMFYGTVPFQNLLGTSAERPYDAAEGWRTYTQIWRNVDGVVSIDIEVDGKVVAEYTNAINPNLRLENFSAHNIILNLNVGSDARFNIFDNSLIDLFDKTLMYVDFVKLEKRSL